MQRVPRYTSYPTAPQFHNGIGAQHYERWLESLEDSHSLSLYFHIPYCRQLCWFCGCHTTIVNHDEPITRYLALLEQEVELIAPKVAQLSVTHIHFGGGSPTVLKPEDFNHFIAKIRGSFTVAKEMEIAVEMDPRTLDATKIGAYASSGVARASLGVQDFEPKVQQAINRVQPYEMVRENVRALRDSGIAALNVDLIYGLPYQTPETIQRTVERTLSLRPDRISLFGYAHVPWMKKHQSLIPEDTLPGEAERLTMYETASIALQQAGYMAIGLDHFARPEDALAIAARNKTLKRNFQGYTTDAADVLLGLGVSAISSLPQGYVQNVSRTVDYTRSIKSGQLPVARGVALQEEDKRRREIIMSLMCHLEAEVDRQSYQEEWQKIQPFIQTGDVRYERGKLMVSPDSRSQLRLIASVFDSYMANTDKQYSRAI